MNRWNIDLTNEQELLLLTGRLSINEEDKIRINDLCSEKINWFEFFKLASYHKMIALCWHNLHMIIPKLYLPKYLEDTMLYVHECTKIRNESNQKELKILLDTCLENGVVCIPVKGTYLIPTIYKDYGIRYSGDMDLLIKFEDISKLKLVLDKIGFRCGTYDSQKKSIIPINRAEEIKWKAHMSNLHPYYKMSDRSTIPFYKLDFRYALDDSLNKEPINEIVDTTIKQGYTSPAHYFIHLCLHFFNEAKHSASIAMAKDINMIKLCDIREFILNVMREEDFTSAFNFADKYNYNQALYYTLFYLKKVYEDGYENKILSKFDIRDDRFLYTYGESTISDNINFKKSFWERFFSCGSINELNSKPKHLIQLD